jgi:hypothetical protein
MGYVENFSAMHICTVSIVIEKDFFKISETATHAFGIFSDAA